MTDKAIAPCPFCGHVGGDLDYYEGSTFRWLTVGCSACGATCGEVHVQTLGEGTREEWLAQAKKEGVDLWNTRAVAQPEPVEPKLSIFKLLAITTAYEQGVGKGKQGTEFNPYTEGTTEREAWRLGYQEGQGMAAAKGGVR